MGAFRRIWREVILVGLLQLAAQQGATWSIRKGVEDQTIQDIGVVVITGIVVLVGGLWLAVILFRQSAASIEGATPKNPLIPTNGGTESFNTSENGVSKNTFSAKVRITNGSNDPVRRCSARILQVRCLNNGIPFAYPRPDELPKAGTSLVWRRWSGYETLTTIGMLESEDLIIAVHSSDANVIRIPTGVTTETRISEDYDYEIYAEVGSDANRFKTVKFACLINKKAEYGRMQVARVWEVD